MYSFTRIALVLMLGCSTFAHSASQTGPVPADDEIRVTFLGTGSPRPSFLRYGPSILVEAGNHRFLVDAGSGMRERLLYAGGFDYITGISHVLITHLHYDHFISLPELWLTGWLYGRRVPLTIYGPEGTRAMMSQMRRMFSWDIDNRLAVGIPEEGIDYSATDIEEGVFYDQDDLRIIAFNVEHLPIDIKTGKRIPFRGATLGYRVEFRGRTVVFSGDTRPSDNLVKFAQNADVLVHETQVPSTGGTVEAQRANISLSVHSTPAQAADIFRRTRPRLAVYSHIIPPQTTAGELIAETRKTYDGRVYVAEDLTTLIIGDKFHFGKIEKPKDRIFEQSGVVTGQH